MKSAWFLQLARLRLARPVLTAALVVGALVAGTVSASAAPDRQVNRFPLHTEGHLIVDSAGQPVHLAASNWYGAESTDFVVGGLQAQPLDDYAWYEHNFNSYAQWGDQIYPKWGYLVTGPNPEPVYVGEFGTCNTSSRCVNSPSTADNGFWFHILTSYLENYNLSWGYWPLNGTQSTGSGRTWNSPETYGVLNPRWNGVASGDLVARLQQIGG